MTNLTEHEKSIAAAAATGLTQKAIAFRLKLSPNTVRNLLTGIRLKLKVTNTAQAVTKLTKLHIINNQQPIDIATVLDSRPERIALNICAWCLNPATDFTNDLSQREYLISGLCQVCQDKTFNTKKDLTQ